MFLRKKRINGSDYWYLVENKREEGRVRQKVIRYIGGKEKLRRFLGGAK